MKSTRNRKVKTICLKPTTLTAIEHYIKVQGLEGRECGRSKYGLSTAIDELVSSALARRGFNPSNLKLIG